MPSKLSLGNALLASLPADELKIVAPELERVELSRRLVLQEANRRASHVWFFCSGVGSAVVRMEDGTTLELATIGREGFVGIPELLGPGEVSHTVFVQVPGEADRMRIGPFNDMLKQLPSLRPLLLRYTLAYIAQIAQSAACNRVHPIEKRCARWLLMTHDRIDGNRFPLTQEFLGQMLGVTRPSVSVAAGMLQRAGYIRYVRGVIEILDRRGLEDACCECYGVINKNLGRDVM